MRRRTLSGYGIFFTEYIYCCIIRGTMAASLLRTSVSWSTIATIGTELKNVYDR